jgi:hypothetical protein
MNNFNNGGILNPGGVEAPTESAEVLPIPWRTRFSPDALKAIDTGCLERLVLAFGGDLADEHGTMHDHAALVDVLVDLAQECFTADSAAFQPTPLQLYRSLQLVLRAETLNVKLDRTQCVRPSSLARRVATRVPPRDSRVS